MIQRAEVCSAVAGDKAEQLLWRLQNGELPASKHPKVVVVMIGTNGELLLLFTARCALLPDLLLWLPFGTLLCRAYRPSLFELHT